MTKEERREYMRKWRENNQENIRKYRVRERVEQFLSSISGDPNAFLEWVKNHSQADPAWFPIAGYWRNDGFPVVVLHNSSVPYGYCVQCAGNGHYFKTEDEANSFIQAWTGKRKIKAP